MTELVVTLTDYFLSLLCTGFALCLYRCSEKKSKMLMLWLIFFISAALESLLGGTVHGFFLDSNTLMYQILWTSTLLTIGATAFCCWVIGGISIGGNKMFVQWIMIASIIFIIYAVTVILYNQNFIIAIINYVPAIIFLLIAMIIRFLKTKSIYCIWVILGIVISLIAAIIQQTGVSLHPIYFNHNSIYHLLQAIGFWFAFKGAKGLVKL